MVALEKRLKAGRAMRKLRTERGWPIAALAARAGTGQGLIVAVERHGHLPTAAVRARLAAALGVGPGEIWPNHEEPDDRQSTAMRGAAT